MSLETDIMNNPLSPHLQVYKWQITSVVSILHRISGVVTSIGFIVLTIWLLAIGISEEAFNFVNSIFTSVLGRAVLIGFTLAVCFNMLNDIRHLFWDYGYGFNLNVAKMTGWLAAIMSIILTILIWIFAYEVL